MRASDFIIRIHKPVIAAAGILAIASAVGLLTSGLREDYRLEAFVASDDDSYARFRAFMEEFTSNEFALIAVHGDAPYGDAMAAFVTDLSNRAGEIDAVARCSSVADVPAAARLLLGDRLFSHPMMAGTLISDDRRTAAILLQMRGEAGAVDEGSHRRETVAKLRQIVDGARARHPEFEIMLAGPYVTLIDMYEYVDRDLLVFSLAAFGLTVIAMWFVFRRAGPMVYAGSVAAAAILIVLGVTVVFGVVASLITQMLVILIIVLCVAHCVHLAVASEEAMLEMPDGGWREVAAATLRRMMWPSIAVMATTAIGFGSVSISQIAPVRRFGWLMVLGLGIGLVVGLAGVVWLCRSRCSTFTRHDLLARRLESVARFSIRWRLTIVAVFAMGAAGVIFGATQLRFESDFVKNFRPESEVRRSYEFIEKNLSPLGSVEVIARRTDGGTVDTLAAIQAADTVVQRARDVAPMVRKGLSLADALTLILPGQPQSDADVQARLGLFSAMPGGNVMLRNFVNDSQDALRINFRCVEGYDVDAKLKACDAIGAEANDVFGDGYSIEVTGLYHFYAGLVSGLLADQYRALAITGGAILLMFALVFRGVRFTLIAALVNALPVACCLGAMGWANIPVNMTTAMMLSAALGIAVDDTIHYLWRYRSERAGGAGVLDALVSTQRSVGRACFFTSVVITAGFTILLLSRFLPTAYFGGLVGFTMVVALAADLLLLPALLFAVDGGGEK